MLQKKAQQLFYNNAGEQDHQFHSPKLNSRGDNRLSVAKKIKNYWLYILLPGFGCRRKNLYTDRVRQ